MSAKLIVHKIESEVDVKSLEITIEDGNDGSSDVKFSKWLNNRALLKRTLTQPRLVVKIVSGNQLNNFNLDICAKVVPENDKKLGYEDLFISGTSNSRETISEKREFICNSFNFDTDYKSVRDGNHYKSYSQNNNNIANRNLLHFSESPLEQSLEKVKENNARIMKNIQMLNQALNNTKKREFIDVGCPKAMRAYACNTCGKCFVYETGLKRHYSLRHSIIESPPRWQTVWTCIECFQVWPRQDLATKHSIQCCKTENIDCVREIKTSSLMQCEFCEKVFTSIPRLLRHSKSHTTANNYECNICEMVFLSYKTAEKHWILCPWLKICYNFSLPKLLLCNTCDRKFRNYDQLYNHRYKVGHFITKTHCNVIDAKSLGVLVYQCEICAQWFTSTSSLQSHRSHHPQYDASNQGLFELYLVNYLPTDLLPTSKRCKIGT